MTPPSTPKTTMKTKSKKSRGGNIKGHKRPNHPPEVTNILKNWLSKHKDIYPYPSNTEKSQLCELTGLTLVSFSFFKK